MSIFESLCKVEVDNITIKNTKGSSMTDIIIALLFCCTAVACCIACFSKIDVHVTVVTSASTPAPIDTDDSRSPDSSLLTPDSSP